MNKSFKVHFLVLILISLISMPRSNADFSCDGYLHGERLNTKIMARLSESILQQKENISLKEWQPVWNSLQAKLSGFELPLAHGTRLDWLDAILDQGLDRTASLNPSKPNANYLCNLKVADGWMGSYAFATWGDFSDFAISAEEITGKTIIDRYVAGNAFLNRNFFWRWLGRTQLKKAFLQYAEVRGQPKEAPLFLIFEGNHELNLQPRSPMIPSELFTTSVVPASYLRYILVPAKWVEEVQAKVSAKGLDEILVLPLELVELNYLHPQE